MIKFTLTLFILIIIPSLLNANVLVDNESSPEGKAANQILLIAKVGINTANLKNSYSKPEYHISQLSEDSSFYIVLSYNSSKSDVLNKDVLSKALREMTTILIGSGLIYVSKEQADFIVKVYIDA